MTEILGTAVRLKTSTGVIDITTAAPPTVGQVLMATSATTAAWANPPSAPVTSSAWTRPAEWIALPVINKAADEIILGLVAVPVADAQMAITISGNYTVDWGDGLTESFSAGVIAKHTYLFSEISTAALSTGFKQVLMKITPQSGQTLTSVELGTAFYTGKTRVNYFQDLTIGGGNITTLSVLGVARATYLESVDIFKTGSITSISGLLLSCTSLKTASIDMPSVTNASSLFSSCRSLEKVTTLSLGTLSNITGIFSNCYAISEIPPISIAPNTPATSAFAACFALTSLPNLAYRLIGNAMGIFQSCYKLKGDITIDFSSTTTLEGAFASCFAIEDVTLTTSTSLLSIKSILDSSGVTSVNAFQTSGVTEASQAFSSCARLRKIPALNLSSALFSSGSYSGPFVNNYVLSKIEAIGIKDHLVLSSTLLTKIELERVFSNLAVVARKILYCLGTPGFDPNYFTNGVAVKVTANATDTVTLSNTSGVTVGKSVVGLRTLTPKTINSTGQDTSTFTSTAHGLTNGQKVTIASATPGLANNGSNYLQVGTVCSISNVTANTFLISPSTGGSPYYATGSSSASNYAVSFVMDIAGAGLQQTSCLITSVVANTSVTLATPLSVSGAVELEIRDVSVYADTTQALYKGWTFSA